MGSGKSAGTSKDYFGHCAGVVCQGNLDFVWGILVNNDLAWPTANQWDSRTYPSGRAVIYLDGNVYSASARTNIDPPAFPWVLLATPYAAGTYHAGDRVLYLGNVWEADSTTIVAPPVEAPDHVKGIQHQPSVGGWFFICQPDAWSAASVFWGAGSIVAHSGRLWTTDAPTKAEPPTAPWRLWRLDLTGANPTKITVEGMGDLYIYRGTPDQVLDASGEAVLTAFGHPPYRNKSVVVLKNFLFGTQQQNPPDVVVMGGRTPVQSLIVGASANLDADWQANPWCVLAELLTHPVFGLGLPNSMFDAASWQAEADRCAANSALFYVSPVYTNQKKVRELVADLLGYPDAFVFWSTVATLKAGHWPHHEAAPAFDAANTVDRDALLEEVESNSGGWGDTANAAGVSFEDVASGFKSRPVFAPNLFNMQVVKRMQVKKSERPHITRSAQAIAWATEMAKIEGDQTARGEVVVRAEKVSNVAPGNLFLLTDDVLGTSVVQRCTKRVVSAPPAGKLRLSHEVERGVSPEPYAPTPENPTSTAGPAPSRVATFGVAQLPNDLGPAFSLAVIAGRGNDVTTSYDAWFKQADDVAFQNLGTMRSFAVPATFRINEISSGSETLRIAFMGAVVQGETYDIGSKGFWNYSVFRFANDSYFGALFPSPVEDVDYSIDVENGTLTIIPGGNIATGNYVSVQLNYRWEVFYDVSVPQSDLDLMTESLTEDEIADGKILVFAFQAADPSLFEIMRVQEIVAGPVVGGKPTWLVETLRAQFGTRKGGDGDHKWGTDSNDLFFVVRKDSIVALEHESFEGFFKLGAEMAMRLVPSSAWVLGDPADVWDPATNPAGLTTDFDYSWSTFQAPTAAYGQTFLNGAAISDFTATFFTTDEFAFAFELDDVNGDLVSGALVATQSQREVTLWSSNFGKTAQVNKTVVFSLPTGTWGVELRMLDSIGNQVSSALLGPDGLPAQIHVEAAGVPTSPTPAIYSDRVRAGSVDQIYFGLLPADINLYWQIVPRNNAPGAWNLGAKNGASIGGLYKYGRTSAYPVGPVKAGSGGQTLYAYASEPGKADSAVAMWNF